DASISAGDSARWTSTYIHQVHAAVFDAQFGLGRLQPLVDDPGVENIKIYGHDRVYLMFSDGHTETGPPVARDDEELTEFLAHLADRDHDLDRSFTRNSPFLDLPLPGRARLAATGRVPASSRPRRWPALTRSRPGPWRTWPTAATPWTAPSPAPARSWTCRCQGGRGWPPPGG